MTEERLIFHHFDPRTPGLGGIDTCIRGLVRFGRGRRFAFVGSTRASRSGCSGEWQHTVMEGNTVRYLYVSRLRDGGHGTPNSLRFVLGAAFHAPRIRGYPVDVVQVHRPETALIARRLFPSSRLDLLLHEDAAHWTTSTSESRWRWFKSTYLRLIRTAVQRADRVVSFSPTASERLSTETPSIISVPTWFDPELFPETPRKLVRGRRVLWIGRLEAVKDPELALSVLQRLDPEDELSIVGEGRLRSQLEQRIGEFRLRERVRLVGAVSKCTVARLLRDHDVVLMTSHSEGFPRTMVEALATGRPVVATATADSGYLLETAVNGGRATTRDPGELAQLVRDCDPLGSSACRSSVAHLAATSIVPIVLGD